MIDDGVDEADYIFSDVSRSIGLSGHANKSEMSPSPDDSIDAQSHSEQSAASRTRGTRAGHGSRRTGIARSEADDVMIVMMINKRSDR